MTLGELHDLLTDLKHEIQARDHAAEKQRDYEYVKDPSGASRWEDVKLRHARRVVELSAREIQ